MTLIPLPLSPFALNEVQSVGHQADVECAAQAPVRGQRDQPHAPFGYPSLGYPFDYAQDEARDRQGRPFGIGDAFLKRMMRASRQRRGEGGGQGELLIYGTRVMGGMTRGATA